jgi:hypothetical protein
MEQNFTNGVYGIAYNSSFSDVGEPDRNSRWSPKRPECPRMLQLTSIFGSAP